MALELPTIGPFYAEIKPMTCTECKNYLSCGPVYIRQRNHSVCGRCVTRNEKGIRNRSYEIAAMCQRFPCKFQHLGCPETQAFAPIYEFSHEYSCGFRTYKCMFADDEDDICFWDESINKLRQHCETSHPNKMLTNCCKLDIDFQSVSNRVFFLIAFDLEFILHIKVCLEKKIRKLIFDLGFLGKPEGVEQFQYAVFMLKNRSVISSISHCGSPAPLEIPMQTIDNHFNGFKGITFQFNIYLYCTRCKKEQILGQLHNFDNHWFCQKCCPQIENCKYKKRGCDFTDVINKLPKHEKYFCKFVNPSERDRTVLSMNYLNYGRIWMVRGTNDIASITTDIGVVVGEFKTDNVENKFELFLYSPLRSDENCEVSIRIYVANPFTCDFVTKCPQYEPHRKYDWKIEINKNKYPSWGSEIAIVLIVQRDPSLPFEI